MTAGFRTSEAGGGPTDGSLYSFKASDQSSRRFKRHLGGSDENTLKDPYTIYFIPPHRADEILTLVDSKGYGPVMYWITTDSPTQAMTAFDEKGNFLPRPKPDLVPALRLYKQDTGYDDRAFVLSDKPQIGHTVLEVRYIPDGKGTFGTRYHIGHPVVELFPDRQALLEKVRALNLPVELGEDGHFKQKIRVIERGPRPDKPLRVIQRTAREAPTRT